MDEEQDEEGCATMRQLLSGLRIWASISPSILIALDQVEDAIDEECAK